MSYYIASGRGTKGGDRKLHSSDECDGPQEAKKLVEASPEQVEWYEECSHCFGEPQKDGGDRSTYRLAMEVEE